MDILISEDIDGAPVQRLAQRFKVMREPKLFQDPERLKETVRHVKALMVRNQTQVSADVIEAAKELKVILRVGVGLDNIDVGAASKAGVVVVAPLEANATSVAELTMGFILALARKLPMADRSTKAGGWDRKGCTGIEIEGKTLVICGFGRIGRLVATRARAFGMNFVVYDPYVKGDSAALRAAGASHCADFHEAIGMGDFVSTHLPLTAETKHLFNEKAFAAMKPGAFFLNTARGGVVEEAALAAALKSGHLAGAALDVREKEPPVIKVGLEQMDNVILTPHIGAFTNEAQLRTLETIATDAENILTGKPATSFVNFAEPGK